MTGGTSVVVAGAALFSRLNDIGVIFRESYQPMDIWRRHSTTVKHIGTIGRTRWWPKDVALKQLFDSFNNPTGALFTEVITAICFCFAGTFRSFLLRHFDHLSHSCVKTHRSSVD